MTSSGVFFRLDPLSTRTKTSHVEGERTVVREVVCYNLRGVMEICVCHERNKDRLNQPSTSIKLMRVSNSLSQKAKYRRLI